MKASHLFLILMLVASQHAFPWGAEGHQAIGMAARQMLSEETAAKVQAILGSTDLGSIATWMDEARAVARRQKTTLTGEDYNEAVAFNNAFKNNASWHFVNLPLAAREYPPNGPFASRNDVVHAILGAIDVLEGKSTQYSKLQALRVIVHMVGDIHQPLHCSSGYFDLTNPQKPVLVTDPAKAAGLPMDNGGNELYYAAKAELHALWDGELVQDAGNTTDPAELARLLVLTPDAQNKLASGGEIRGWPARWAVDSASLAEAAYKPLTFGAATVTDSPSGRESISRLEIVLGPNANQYRTGEAAVVKSQLQKAAVHLAQLLNGIKFE